MALSEGRIHGDRATPYPWERQALDLVYKHESLSDTDPHQAWELHELYDPSSGRLQVRREWRDFALKVPHDAGCGERLLAEAPVPALLPSQRLVMPDAWLANAHKAAETP